MAEMDLPLVLDDVFFWSELQVRYEQGLRVSYEDNEHAKRAIIIRPNLRDNKGYTVEVYSGDDPDTDWEDNPQMAPQTMEVIAIEEGKIKLQGYGGDAARHALTIGHDGNSIKTITIHLLDEGVDTVHFPLDDPDLIRVSYHPEWNTLQLVPDLSDHFEADLAMYFNASFQKNKEGVLGEDLIEICTDFAVQVINGFQVAFQYDDLESGATFPGVPIKEIMNIKDQMYWVVIRLVPSLDVPGFENLLSQKTNHAIATVSPEKARMFLEWDMEE